MQVTDWGRRHLRYCTPHTLPLWATLYRLSLCLCKPLLVVVPQCQHVADTKGLRDKGHATLHPTKDLHLTKKLSPGVCHCQPMSPNLMHLLTDGNQPEMTTPGSTFPGDCTDYVHAFCNADLCQHIRRVQPRRSTQVWAPELQRIPWSSANEPVDSWSA